MINHKLTMYRNHAPIIFVTFYICISILVYWAGPINWPTTNGFELAAFQCLVVLAILLGYFSDNSKLLIRNERSLNLKPIFKIGAWSTLALQIPLTLTYTNKYPWDIYQTIFDQGLAYEEMLGQVLSQQSTRFYVPLFRSAIMPLYFAALAYGILNFRKLLKFDKFLLFLLILCPINLSLLRGTDKEIFDTLIIATGLILISITRTHLNKKKFIGKNFKKILLTGLVIFTIFIIIFLSFTYRKYQRMGSTNEFCFAENLVCAEYNGVIMSIMPDFINFGFSMFAAYLTNGYYGLSLALNQPLEFAYGIGHSSALQALFEKVFDFSIIESTLIGKVSASGWDHRNYWHTIFPWIASDVGFIGSLFFICIIGRLFRQSWKDSIYLNNDCAAIVFVLLCILFFYLPANNQLTQTLDSYFTFVCAFMAWKLFNLSNKITLHV